MTEFGDQCLALRHFDKMLVCRYAVCTGGDRAFDASVMLPHFLILDSD